MPDFPDVDLDVRAREEVIVHFPTAIEASKDAGGMLVSHRAGLHFQAIPVDPITGLAAFPYEIAKTLGYNKIDVLSNGAYTGVESSEHLDELLAAEIPWRWFTHVEFVNQLFHFRGDTDWKAKVVVDYAPQSILDLAHLIALIRPAKKHLIGRSWDVLRAEMWTKDPQGRAQFKKSHACAYAMVVVVDAQLKGPAFFT